MRTPFGAASWLLWVVATTGGCALLSKSDPTVPRYYSPEISEASALGPTRGATSGLELRLGRVNAAAFLKDKVVYRDSTYEVGYYEEVRWTEKPEVYVRRALSRALFDRRGLRQVVAGPGPTLDVDLLAFEEVRGSPHLARIQLSFVLHDERVVWLAQSLTVDRPVPEPKGAAPGDAFVRALAQALDVAVDTVSERVVGGLRVNSAAPGVSVRDVAGQGAAGAR